MPLWENQSMPDTATVSVIIPAFNAATTLRDTVESVFAQTYRPNQIIIVDDGSTDETPEVAASLGERIESIRINNTGLPAAARNRGARAVTSEWIAFLDADDTWEPNKLEAQLEVAKDRPQVGVVYTDRWNIGNVHRTTTKQSDSVTLAEGDLFHALLAGNFITTSSVLVKREPFLALDGFSEDPDLRGCEDWDLWLRLSAAGHEFALCREPLTSYRLHEGTVSNSHQRMCSGRLATIQRAVATDRGRSLPRRVVRDAIARAWACSAWHIAPVDRWRALEWYARSSWHAPGEVSNYKGAIKCLIGRTD